MNDTIRPRSVIDAESAPTARERAVQRGWHIDRLLVTAADDAERKGQ